MPRVPLSFRFRLLRQALAVTIGNSAIGCAVLFSSSSADLCGGSWNLSMHQRQRGPGDSVNPKLLHVERYSLEGLLGTKLRSTTNEIGGVELLHDRFS